MMKFPCLAVHGLTASPAQIAPQVEALRAAGAVVSAPTLSGHNGDIKELDTLLWEDWYADLLRAAARLQQQTGCQQINYFGLSWGGLLGLKLALDRPDLVRRLVVVGAPVDFHTWVKMLLPLVRYTPLRWLVRRWPKNNKYCVADPSGCAEYRKTSYAQFPIAPVYQVQQLQKIVRASLPDLQVPTLIMHSDKDRTAPPLGAQYLADRTGAELVWLRHSYHVATLDYERDMINERIVEFFGGTS